MIGVIAVWRERLRYGRPAESRARGQVGHRRSEARPQAGIRRGPYRAPAKTHR